MAEPTPPADPTSGTWRLKQIGLAKLLHNLSISQRTGTLVLKRGEVSKSIFFKNGYVMFAESNLATDRLGEVLCRRGEITRAQLSECLAESKRTGKMLGAVLVEKNVLRAERLLPAIEVQVREIVLGAFSWDDGEYLFSKEFFGNTEDLLDLKIRTADLILEGVRRTYTATQASRVLGDVGRPPKLSAESGYLSQELTVNFETSKVLSKVDGQRTISQIVAETGLTELTVLQILAALAHLKILDVDPTGHTGKITVGGAGAAANPPVPPPTPGATDVRVRAARVEEMRAHDEVTQLLDRLPPLVSQLMFDAAAATPQVLAAAGSDAEAIGRSFGAGRRILDVLQERNYTLELVRAVAHLFSAGALKPVAAGPTTGNGWQPASPAGAWQAAPGGGAPASSSWQVPGAAAPAPSAGFPATKAPPAPPPAAGFPATKEPAPPVAAAFPATKAAPPPAPPAPNGGWGAPVAAPSPTPTPPPTNAPWNKGGAIPLGGGDTMVSGRAPGPANPSGPIPVGGDTIVSKGTPGAPGATPLGGGAPAPVPMPAPAPAPAPWAKPPAPAAGAVPMPAGPAPAPAAAPWAAAPAGGWGAPVAAPPTPAPTPAPAPAPTPAPTAAPGSMPWVQPAAPPAGGAARPTGPAVWNVPAAGPAPAPGAVSPAPGPAAANAWAAPAPAPAPAPGAANAWGAPAPAPNGAAPTPATAPPAMPTPSIAEAVLEVGTPSPEIAPVPSTDPKKADDKAQDKGKKPAPVPAAGGRSRRPLFLLGGLLVVVGGVVGGAYAGLVPIEIPGLTPGGAEETPIAAVSAAPSPAATATTEATTTDATPEASPVESAVAMASAAPAVSPTPAPATPTPAATATVAATPAPTATAVAVVATPKPVPTKPPEDPEAKKKKAATFVKIGNDALNAGDATKAIRNFGVAIANDPTNADAHLGLGTAYMLQGENAKAKRSLQKFLQLAPDHQYAPQTRQILNTL